MNNPKHVPAFDPGSKIPHPKSDAFWLPKAGHRGEEYEDAFALSEAARLPMRLAVADGATESAFAGAWAQHLVRQFVDESVDSETDLRERLPAWQAAWQVEVGEQAKGLPWYAAAKAEQGAFAAMLGLTVRPEGTWKALAVGDCDLLHLRDGALHAAWPLDDPEQFTHRPALLSSREGAAVPAVQERSGTWRPGDAFVLATDALAAWLLATDPARALGWTDATFLKAVDAARAEGVLRNDDVTLVRLMPREE